MDGNSGTPPALGAARFRWWIHLVLLGVYPLLVGAVPFFLGTDRNGTVLPSTVPALIKVMLVELAVFGTVFLVAWFASRASREQLLLTWNGKAKPIWLGLLYSMALRVAMMVLVIVVGFIVLQLGVDREFLQRLRPRPEALVNAQLLAENPVYFALNLTLVSFVVAGFREELWRAGVLAGMTALFPNWFGSVSGRLLAVGIAAVLFGLGHVAQGIGGVIMTALLGFGLGVIIVFHRSIWEAVFAHGFFNAISFAALYYLATRAPHLLP